MALPPSLEAQFAELLSRLKEVSRRLRIGHPRLVRLLSDAGTYSVDGNNADFTKSTPQRSVDADAGTYAVTGVAANLNKTTASGAPYTLTAARGTFAYTGLAAGFAVESNPNAPIVLYTDTPTIPTAGGENGLGGYLSIFGKNFGSGGLGTTVKVFIGSTEVANYRCLMGAVGQVATKLGIQRITVQVGALGGQTGALPVKVQVGGVDSNTDVTVRPVPTGRVLFCSLTGNNSTAVVNDITKPWRHLQQPLGAASVYTSMQAGDQIVVRGGNWNDTTGVDTTWLKFSGGGTPARNGTATAYIHFTGYPGPINGNAPEDVHYSTPNSTSGGFHGIWSAREGESGNYAAFSNFRIDQGAQAAQDAAPFNTQYIVGPWWVTNNAVGPWPVSGVSAAKAGGVSGHGRGVRVLGNYFHDIAGTSALENHGVYADTHAWEWEVGYNVMINITGGSAIQFNDNSGGVGTTIPNTGGVVWPGFTDMLVHHNWLENIAKYGVNWNDQGGAGGYYSGKVWNNVLIKTGGPPFRRSHGGSATDDILFAFNTLYNCSTNSSTFPAGYYADEYVGNSVNIKIRLYHNIFAIGPNSESGVQWAYLNSSMPGLEWVGNLYWNNTQSPATNTTDATRIVANPLFANAAASDLSLLAGSPALNVATATLPYSLTVNNDFILTTRPQGAARDIGAFERV